MKKSQALKKLEKFCEDIEKDNAKNLAKWILEFVEQDLEMVHQNNITKELFYQVEYSASWDEENGEET